MVTTNCLQIGISIEQLPYRSKKPSSRFTVIVVARSLQLFTLTVLSIKEYVSSLHQLLQKTDLMQSGFAMT